MRRLKELLKQGSSPELIAKSAALGFALGLFPIPGFPTPICILVGVHWKLNHTALQAANWLTYPIYFPAMWAFTLLGRTIFGGAPLSLTASGMWRGAMYASVGWALAAPFVWAIAYLPLRLLLRRFARAS